MTPAPGPAFSGFPREAMTFLRELRDNNARDWFAPRRGIYEAAVKAPAHAFLAAVEPALAGIAGERLAGRVFRIHRDVRFSRDKSPYNAHLHIAFLPAPGRFGAPGFFVALEPERLLLGAGVFELSGGALDRFRAAVAEAASGARLEAILADLAAAGLRLEGPELKRAPAPFGAGHPRAALLRRKGLSAWRSVTDAALIASPAALDACLVTFAALAPLHRWLRAALRQD